MKSSKKIISLSLAATMLATSTGAFAMPSDTIVIGDQAFGVFDLAQEGLQDEINEALNEYNDSDQSKIIYSLNGFKDGEFVSLDDDAKISEEDLDKLENIKLYDENGNIIEFASFDDEKGNADAKDKESLQQLINNGNVDTLKLTADVELEDALDVTQLVNLDLNGHTLKGDLVVKSEAEGNMILKGAENSVIDGNLTINTKDADFIVGENTTIKGKTTIEDVKGSTFVNKGTLAEVVIEDPNGAGFQNDGAVEVVEINTKAKVVLKGDNKITKLKVEMEGAQIDLAVDVADLVADKACTMMKVGDVKVDKLEGAQKEHMQVKDQDGHVIKVDDIVKPDGGSTGGNTGGSTGGGSVVPPVVVPTTASVSTAKDFAAAVANANIETITVTGDIDGDLNLVREGSKDLTINFAAYKEIDDVTITALEAKKITLNDAGVEDKGAQIANLTIDAPQAHVENNVEVTGDINIEAVATSTFVVKDAAPSIKMQGAGKLDVELADGVTAKAPAVSVETDEVIELAGTVGEVAIDENKASKAKVKVTATKIGPITGSGAGQNITLDTEAEVEVKGTVGQVALEKPAKVKVNAHVQKIEVKTKEQGVTIEANQDIPEIVTSADIEISGNQKVKNLEISKDSAKDIKITANAPIGKIKTDKSIQIGGDEKIDEVQVESKKGQAKVEITVDKNSKQEKVEVVNTGDGEVEAKKGEEKIEVAKKAKAPTNLQGLAPKAKEGKGKITGTSAAMEYATSENAEKWTSCLETKTELAPGTYYVRVKATEDKLASDAVEVVVGEYQVTDKDKVEAAIGKLKLEVAEGEKVTENIQLPAKQDDAKIEWKSSKTEVISTTGEVTRQDEDTEVTLTATLKVGEATATKAFTVTVKAKEQTTPTQEFAVEFSKDLSSATSVTFAADETKAVKLTAKDLSKDVTLAVYGGDKEVTEFVYSDVAGWTDGSNKNLDPSNGLVVNFDTAVSSVKIAGNVASLNSIGLDTKDTSVTAEVYADGGSRNYTYDNDNGKWEADAVVKEQAKAPTDLQGLAPTTKEGKGQITGTSAAMEYATSENAEKWTSCFETKTELAPGTYYVRVKATEDKLASDAVEVVVGEYQVTDKDKVEAAIGKLKLEVAEGEKVTENIQLQAKQDDAKIEWKSSKTEVISTTGEVTRQDEDTEVTLTATLTVGEATATKAFTVTVKAKEQEIVEPTSLAVNFAEDMQSVSIENASIFSVTLKDDLKENVSFTVYESGTDTTEFVYTNAGWNKGKELYEDTDGSNLTVTFSGMNVTKVQEGNLGEVDSMNISVAQEAQSVSYEVYTEDGNTTTYVYGQDGWEKTTK